MEGEISPNVIPLRPVDGNALQYDELKKYTVGGGDFEVVLARLRGDEANIHLMIMGEGNWLEPIKSFVDNELGRQLADIVGECCDIAASAAIGWSAE
ncbi:MAG: hypothetical protein DI629_12090 [Mesorhizobium amorphae]|nr:MAG: hypothetical protein DI629_12090 [Mesorhizobium amorphae]